MKINVVCLYPKGKNIMFNFEYFLLNLFKFKTIIKFCPK